MSESTTQKVSTGSTQRITLAKGLNMGLRKAMEDDPKVLIMGEDVGKLGGVFRITDGLQKDFGEDRVIDSPLAESGIVGTAVGMALRGYRPVVEIQFDGFVYPAYDQIVCQVAKMQYRSKGHYKMPMVIRIPFGGGIGAVEHHSESPEAQFAHTPGLKVVACCGFSQTSGPSAVMRPPVRHAPSETSITSVMPALSHISLVSTSCARASAISRSRKARANWAGSGVLRKV